jgi:TonB-linked SusC/RagA family outer membrane protein
MEHRRSAWTHLVAGVAALSLAASVASAQSRATVTGQVIDGTTEAPIPNVTVQIIGTSLGTQTNAEGRYTIANAPVGVYAVEARRIGYQAVRETDVSLVAGESRTVNFTMRTNALRLESVVVSGTVDPISGRKAPFSIARLDVADLPVPTTGSAAGSLQGKVAGAKIIKGGGPGAGVNIQLRSPVSQFKSNSPLYVVDGVFLNSQQVVTTSDIEAMDIESIEVIKGAAAAALYGSRAAGGVISITTKRGRNVALGSTEFTVRSEYGVNQQASFFDKRTHHNFRQNEQGQWVNAAGAVVSRASRVQAPNNFADQPYMTPLYDHTGQFFKDGQFLTTTLGLAQNTQSTNFNLAYSRTKEEGVVLDADGITRQTIRANIDHRLRDDFSVSLSAAHSRTTEDPASVSFNDFYRIDPDVNLLAPNADGTPYLIVPDSASSLTNPLYRQILNDNRTTRARTLVSGTASYRPISWLTFDGAVSYDRGDRIRDNYIPRGMIDTDGETPSLGFLRLEEDFVDGLNAQVGGTVLRAFDELTARFTVRGELQRESNLFFRADGEDFSVAGIRDLTIARERSNTSSFTDRRGNSGFASLGLDYADKYVFDAVFRRDGSSLFGPDARYNNFYSVKGAYLLNEEPWWPMPAFTLFKLYYSRGTAGTRPGFSDQFETIEILDGGGLTRQALGNSRLRPEITTEQEFGLDAIVNDRVSVSLVYAQNRTTDNIIGIPVPGSLGFNTQEANVGSLKGNTVEATVQAQVISTPRFNWEFNLVADRSRNRVQDFNRSCYEDGILWRCEGVVLGSFWGRSMVRDVSQLRTVHANSHDAFQVNDEGYLVPVGVGNSYTEGVAKGLWGRNVTIDGQQYAWGQPFAQLEDNGTFTFRQIGDGNADVNFGLGNTFRYRGFQLYGLFTGQLGGDVYALGLQRVIQSADHASVDQFGRPEELKKPVTYYTNGVSQGVADYVDNFVYDGTYAKLSELSLRYTVPQTATRWLGRVGADRLSLELVGRNLFTITNYPGLDPEDGTPLSRIEDNNYPMYRTWSTAVNIVF